jgi:uncharacterized protein DUF6134
MKNPYSYSLFILPAAKKTLHNYSCLKKAFLFLTIFLFLFSVVNAQEQKTEYKVIFHGDSVGNMLLYKNKTGDNISFSSVSNVLIRFFIKVKVVGKEESNFQSGRLMYSNVSRIVNGKEKASKQTKAIGNTYETTSFGKSVPSTNKLIDYNFNMLYCQEPFNKQTVYSDNFQQFLTVEQVALHKYKVVLPDGNYNYYTFSNGICSMVELHHSFYTVYIQLEA